MVLEIIPILSVLLIGFATFLILSGRKKRFTSFVISYFKWGIACSNANLFC